MKLQHRDYLALVASSLIWVAGCARMGIADPFKPAADTVVYGNPDPQPGLYLSASEIKPVAEMPREDESWKGFKIWKANVDPSAPFAGLRRWMREQDEQ